LRGER